MLHYKIYQNKNKKAKGYGKYYGRVVINQTLTLDQLAEHMANHNTPYSKGAIYGVLTDMVKCIHELVLDGNAVKIPNLAIISAGIKTTAADAAGKFSAANILSVHLRARPAGSFSRAELSKAARTRQIGTYYSDKSTNES